MAEPRLRVAGFGISPVARQDQRHVGQAAIAQSGEAFVREMRIIGLEAQPGFGGRPSLGPTALTTPQIGRASCRERVGQYVEISVVAVCLKKKKKNRKLNT